MNAHQITVKQYLEETGETLEDVLEQATSDSIAPALCDEGCEVEPDGHCPHGCPSILLEVGII